MHAAGYTLRDAVHLDCGLHTHLHAALLERIGQRQRIDRRRQHAHMVRAGAFHLAAAVLDAAPEIAAADHNTDLTALFVAFFNHIANRTDHVKIQSEMLIARKRFAADFIQHAFISFCFHAPHSLLHFPRILFYPITAYFAKGFAMVFTIYAQLAYLFSKYAPLFTHLRPEAKNPAPSGAGFFFHNM